MQVLQIALVKEIEYLVMVFNFILAVHLIQTEIILYIFSKMFHSIIFLVEVLNFTSLFHLFDSNYEPRYVVIETDCY